MHVCFASDSHRKSGVFSFCSLLSPVESLSPPELIELTPPVYSLQPFFASEGLVNTPIQTGRCFFSIKLPLIL